MYTGKNNQSSRESYRIGRDAADQILLRLKLEPYLVSYGVRFNAQGFALCPFHSEDTASFRCKGAWYHCFGCGTNGTLLTFVCKHFKISRDDALRKIEEDFRLGLPVKGGMDFGAKHRAAKAIERRKTMVKDAENAVWRAERAYADALAQWEITRDMAEVLRNARLDDDDAMHVYSNVVWREEKRLEELKLAEARLLEVKSWNR